jgi:hypothetical protein
MKLPSRLLIPVLPLFVLLTTSLYAQRDLTTERSVLFSGAGNCTLCHGPGSSANVTSAGKDVSPPNLWRSTMMANAARDPFWQAVVESESAKYPQLAGVIEDRCTNCHAPMGHEQARQDGDGEFLLAEAESSPLAMDGVSCTLCHQVEGANFGSTASFSGAYEIASSRVTYGPYDNPLIQPMRDVSGYDPVFSPHIEEAGLCATCHTLFTPYIDDQGNIAGEFPEQVPFLEWKRSVYPERGTSCQSCHMPAIDEAIRISSLPQSSPPRSPYFQHHFVGGNTLMQSIFKAHGDELGVTALDEHFDSTYARTNRQLIEDVVTLDGGAWLRQDTLQVLCRIENKTGHKFPTGFPSRRAWLHLTVRDNSGRLLFESGAVDAESEIIGLDDPFEPHHTVITDEGQVQVYESVMGDVNGVATVDLLRASHYLKDNRIPPLGFSVSAMANDTVGVFGNARSDPDFGRQGMLEGTAADQVHYRINVDPAGYPFSVSAAVVYQSIKPEFIRGLDVDNKPKAERMLRFWREADRRQTVISQREWTSTVVGIGELSAPASIEVGKPWPMPLTAEQAGMMHLPITLTHPAPVVLQLIDVLGRGVQSLDLGVLPSGRSVQMLPIAALPRGMYLLHIRVDNTDMALPLWAAER